LEQKAVAKQALLGRRFDFVGAIYGGNYKPEAKCPACGRSLTPIEIMQGFRNDPLDYTTECTSCHGRFAPKIVWRDSDISCVELPFYCSEQVLARLEGLAGKTPDQIQKDHAAIYHSVLIHHGNLRRAFQRIGIQYPYENVMDWQEKVRDFLGKLPDTVVASVVDLPVRKIRNLRKSFDIQPFSYRELAGAG
jgi:hypothetical protein